MGGQRATVMETEVYEQQQVVGSGGIIKEECQQSAAQQRS